MQFIFSPWLYGPALFFVWLLVAYSVKGIFLGALKKWDEKSARKWGQFLAEGLKIPLNILILGGGLALLESLLPLPPEFDQPMLLAVKVLIILSVFFFLDRLILELLRHFAGKVHAIDLTGGIIHTLVRVVTLSFGLMILLDAIGISITPLVASLGIGSLAIALGLQETLTNLIAGLYIVTERPVRVGDFIKLESGEEGYVTDIGWRNTRIRMLPDILVVVPNNKLISSTIHNYYLPTKETAALLQVGVAYGSDLEKVERVTVETAREVQKKVQGAVPQFEPLIRYHTFGDSGINFTVVLRVKEFTDQFLVKHEFIKALHVRYQKEGIVIPYPVRTLDIPQEALRRIVQT